MSKPNQREIIESNLDNIEKWAAEGLTNLQIAQKLGVSKSCFYKYKKDMSTFEDSLKKGRKVAVTELENTLFKSATGYTRKVKKYEKLKRIIYENGKKAEEWEEMTEYEVEEYVKPETAAGIFLLKNWAKYMDNPRLMELRKEEIELRKKQVDSQIW